MFPGFTGAPHVILLQMFFLNVGEKLENAHIWPLSATFSSWPWCAKPQTLGHFFYNAMIDVDSARWNEKHKLLSLLWKLQGLCVVLLL